MTSMRKNSCYIKYDWLDIFPEPIKFRVTSQTRIGRHYKKGLLAFGSEGKRHLCLVYIMKLAQPS